MAERLTERAVYILPLRWQHPDRGELTQYLVRLSSWIDVVVVDGSPAPVFAQHHDAWAGMVTHVAPRPVRPDENGKAVGVVEGLRASRAPLVVIADDDVRYDRAGLERVLRLLEHADVVRPQNHFTALPWHARWDTARSLINRATAGDFPGTLGLRRAALDRGYDTRVLFENLELLRTVRAGGGLEVRADDLFVGRRPPSADRFLSQRVRQAYDSQAQPVRLALELALLPLVVWAARRPRRAAALALATVLLAHRGRASAGGRAVFPASGVLLAPAWVLERAVCAWVALAVRMAGGVAYSGSRLPRAAHSERWIRAARDRLSPLEPSTAAEPSTATLIAGKDAQ